MWWREREGSAGACLYCQQLGGKGWDEWDALVYCKEDERCNSEDALAGLLHTVGRTVGVPSVAAVMMMRMRRLGGRMRCNRSYLFFACCCCSHTLNIPKVSTYELIIYQESKNGASLAYLRHRTTACQCKNLVCFDHLLHFFIFLSTDRSC